MELDCLNTECKERYQVDWDHAGDTITCVCGLKLNVMVEENIYGEYFLYFEIV